jgi:hypothetical protein
LEDNSASMWRLLKSAGSRVACRSAASSARASTARLKAASTPVEKR